MTNRKDFLDYDSGIMSEEREIAFFQELADTHQLDELPPRYGQRARELASRELVFL